MAELSINIFYDTLSFEIIAIYAHDLKFTGLQISFQWSKNRIKYYIKNVSYNFCLEFSTKDMEIYHPM